MPNYRVVWEFDVDDVANPREAAEVAFETVQRPGTSANVFDVYEHGKLDVLVETVDLDPSNEAGVVYRRQA
jgi:hypothetical protein